MGIPGDISETDLTLLHSDRPKLYTILAFLSAIGLSNSETISALSPYIYIHERLQRLTVKILNIGTCMSEQTV